MKYKIKWYSVIYEMCFKSDIEYDSRKDALNVIKGYMRVDKAIENPCTYSIIRVK